MEGKQIAFPPFLYKNWEVLNNIQNLWLKRIRYLVNIRFYIMDMVVRHRLKPRVFRLQSFKEGVANTFATPSSSHLMQFSLPYPL